ncbi:MAG TPA: hypothetical protein VMI54_09135 [Polyangiaceae bacterium]|nr:hypothetical protein [Polyangiaceae bacterium]
MRRAWLGAALALALPAACDSAFSFDREGATAGSGGAAPMSSGVAGYDETTEDEAAGGARDAENCAHCADYGLKCATEWEACVECLTDDDCSSSLPYCDPALHRCLPCNTSSGCDANCVCDGWSHACMRTCDTQSEPGDDCDGAPRMCDARRNVCVVCHDDDDCQADPTKPHCAPGGAACAECASDRDCGAGLHCDPLIFSCVSCRDSRDCALGAVCDSTAHLCVGTVR